METMKFHKSLATYYLGWLRDCNDSVIYCLKHGDPERAQHYRERAARFFDLINENWKAIEFFSQEDNAFKIDSSLPEEFRGYE